MDNNEFLKKVRSLIQMHSEGLLGGELMPEDALIDVVPKDKLMDVLTLGMSLNYQRNSYALWQAVAKAYLDKDSRWVFDPNIVYQSSTEDLRSTLLQYRIALQPNRHPQIWKSVACGINASSLKGDVLGLISSANFDIANLKTVMQNTRKSEFPYLSGPKIFNYWLYVLESYTEVNWKSRELITIAPDTHILQATVKLGLCSAEVLNGSADDREAVAQKWDSALLDSGLAPIDVHTPLWLWSRAGFPELSLSS